MGLDHGQHGGPRKPHPAASHRARPESPVLSGHVGPGDLPGVRRPGRSRPGVLPRQRPARGQRPGDGTTRGRDRAVDPGPGHSGRAPTPGGRRGDGAEGAATRDVGLGGDVDRRPGRSADRLGRDPRGSHTPSGPAPPRFVPLARHCDAPPPAGRRFRPMESVGQPVIRRQRRWRRGARQSPRWGGCHGRPRRDRGETRHARRTAHALAPGRGPSRASCGLSPSPGR